MNKKNIKKFIFCFASSVIFLLFITSHASAATLYIAPSSSKVALGSTFSVAVKTDTKGAKVNVAEATINWSSDKLQVVSVSPGSTFTLETPGSPSKTSTKVFFSAGLPSPGYKGSSGILGNITFRAINIGDATISITSGKVLLNDGNATDVLSGTSSSVISITQPNIIPAVQQEQPDQLNTTNITNTGTEQSIELQPTQSVLTPSDNVFTATIVITVADLIHILYILIVLVILLLIAVIYLLVVNRRLKGNKQRK